MCGRFSISVNNEDMRQYLIDSYDIEDFNNDIKLPRYNVAPGQNVIAIINDGSRNRVGLLKWGFVPFFAKDEKIGYKMINAKSETVSDKPSFRESFINKRCIILADGFYEWQKTDYSKIPMRILLKDHSIFPMAGLWSSYTRSDGSKLFSCTILTTNANKTVSPIHDRMPVILSNESKNVWLNPTIKDKDLLTKLLIPYDDNKMYTYKVSTLVNKATNESAEIINSI